MDPIALADLQLAQAVMDALPAPGEDDMTRATLLALVASLMALPTPTRLLPPPGRRPRRTP